MKVLKEFLLGNLSWSAIYSQRMMHAHGGLRLLELGVSSEIVLSHLIHTFIKVVLLLVPSLCLELLSLVLSHILKRHSLDLLELLGWRDEVGKIV